MRDEGSWMRVEGWKRVRIAREQKRKREKAAKNGVADAFVTGACLVPSLALGSLLFLILSIIKD